MRSVTEVPPELAQVTRAMKGLAKLPTQPSHSGIFFFFTKVVNEIQITTYFMRETVIKCLEWAIATDEFVPCRACAHGRAEGEREGFLKKKIK